MTYIILLVTMELEIEQEVRILKLDSKPLRRLRTPDRVLIHVRMRVGFRGRIERRLRQ